MATIALKNVRKSYGNVEVVKGVSFEVADGDFAVLVGPSGCGKSTLLRMIAGLESITSGELKLDGKRMNDVPPDQRGIAMVFHSYALYPHMRVAENIGFSLDLKKVPKAQIAKEVGRLAELSQLSGLLDRRPAALSGGQRQRVAIGRAIIKQPRVILFDEPLSNLDAALRVQMRAELQKLHQELKPTIVYVTHDQVEAMTMASPIVVLNQGEVAQWDAPIELYRHPNSTFVATFIGSPRMNLVSGSIAGANGAPSFAAAGGRTVPSASSRRLGQAGRQGGQVVDAAQPVPRIDAEYQLAHHLSDPAHHRHQHTGNGADHTLWHRDPGRDHLRPNHAGRIARQGRRHIPRKRAAEQQIKGRIGTADRVDDVRNASAARHFCPTTTTSRLSL